MLSYRRRVDRLMVVLDQNGPREENAFSFILEYVEMYSWRHIFHVGRSGIIMAFSTVTKPFRKGLVCITNETFDLKNEANAIYQGPQRPIFWHAPSQKIALAKMISITFKNYFVTQILHDKWLMSDAFSLLKFQIKSFALINKSIINSTSLTENQ